MCWPVPIHSSPHHEHCWHQILQTPRIQSWQDKVETLLNFGLDCVIIEEFSLTFAGYRPDWFAREIIGRRLCANAVVVGYDFRYGKARGGTVDTLRRSLQI